MEIIFKQTRKHSNSCGGYRQIIKRGDTQYDLVETSDDAIVLYTKDYKKIAIDCDRDTGEFRLFAEDDVFRKQRNEN